MMTMPKANGWKVMVSDATFSLLAGFSPDASSMTAMTLPDTPSTVTLLTAFFVLTSSSFRTPPG